MPMTRFPEVKQALFDACLKRICDEGETPQIEVFTGHPAFVGPREYESAKQMTIFNISGKALKYYDADITGINFTASFKGVSTSVYVPWDAVACVFAKEKASTLMQPFAFDIEGAEDLFGVAKKEPEIKLVHTNKDPKPSGEKRKGFKPKLVKR